MAFPEKSFTKKQPTDAVVNSNNRIKVGIIGLGHMGGYHASACKLIPSIKLEAIADPYEKNWAKITEQNVFKTNNFIDILPHVDAVIIAAPTDFHYEITKQCLLAGKHILVEKPLTKNLDQAQELFEIAQKNHLAFHVGHIERYNGAVQELKKIIHSPYLIESHRVGPFSPRVQNDSVILDLMIHDLDIIVGLVDSPVIKVDAVGHSVVSSYTDIASVQITFQNGVLAHITSSRASQIKKRTMAIHQKNAFIQLDFTTQDIAIHRHTSESVKIGHNQLNYTQESTIERVFVYKDNPLKIEIETFVQAILTGKNLFDPEQDIEALRLALFIDEQVRQK